MTSEGLVFDIQRFSVHDGPGIRTTVFLKGCSLRCFWCQNPEGINLGQEIMFFPERCIGCARCIAACPQRAHVRQGDAHVYLRAKCLVCGKCAETCYADALMPTARSMTVDDVVEEVLRDRVFYEESNGGVTLSGGGPVTQHEFSTAILEQCKIAGLHTAVETEANCPWTDLLTLLPVTDLIMIDIKHIDPDKHRKVTGVSNGRILENATRLAQMDQPFVIRVPVIPTVNDTTEEIGRIADFARVLANLKWLELVRFHRLGEDKYHGLGLNYAAGGLRTPAKQKMNELVQRARESGIEVRVV